MTQTHDLNDKRIFSGLPPVLYNGQPRWHAAEDIAGPVKDVSPDFDRYRPHVHYLLLDAHHIMHSRPAWQ